MATQAAPGTLLAAVEDVVAGRATADQLHGVVATVRQELQQTHQEFSGVTQQLQPEVRQAVSGFIDQAFTSIAAYNHALDILERYVRTGDRQWLLQGSEQVRRCMFQTSYSFVVFRDAVLVATGPTEIPTLNLLLQAYGEIQAGSAPPEKLLVFAERERRRAIDELARLDANPPGVVKVAALQRAWRDHRDCMASLIAAVRAQDTSGVEEQLTESRETFAALQRLIPAVQEALDSQGPSPSPLVNIVLNLARGMTNGTVPQDSFLTAVNTLRQTIASTASQLEILAGLGDDEAVVEPLQRVREAVAVYREGFAAIDRFVEQRDLTTLQQGMQTLEVASRVLHDVQQQVLQKAETARQATVACIRCGHPNTFGRVRCERCGSGLPVAEEAPVQLREFGEEGGGPPPAETLLVSKTLRRLYDAVNGAADETLPVEKFCETVQWFEDQVNQVHAVTDQLTAEQEQVLVSAVEGFQRAIAQFLAFAEDNDKTHLVDGGRLCNDAAHLLNSIHKAKPTSHSLDRPRIAFLDDEDGSGEIVG